MPAYECEFFSQDYCCPPDYIVKAGFVCPMSLPMQEGDITNKCGGSNDELMTEEEWEERKTHKQPAEPEPEPDDPLKRWKAHPVQKKRKEMELIEETMR